MTQLFKMLSVLPLWLLQGIGWFLGWAAFVVSPSYRARLIAHASQAGLTGSKRWASVGAAGKLVAELPRLWLGVDVDVAWEGAQHVEAALERKKGVIFLTPHLGCFEITAQAYAKRYGRAGHPITVLFRPPRQSWLAPLVVSSRARDGLETAPTSLAGVKQMLKALKKGCCVGLLPDQVPPLGQGVWASFFGRSAYTMTLSVRLAVQTGATVLIAWGERLPYGRGYVVHVEPLGQEISSDLEHAVVQINQSMESLIMRAPEQYLWGYARYKQPRNDAQ
jgi:Kdo2-lipid IVA lauroyltransferase/acyltransferase